MRCCEDRWSADRIRSVILLCEGVPIATIAEVLFLDRKTVQEYFYTYKEGGMDALLANNDKDSSSFLNDEQKE
ncbi:MAG: helix-turn-helix domain-containing protein [Planctomycetaceae bacterium]|nr:helix-turn-helix domain-containing protein [Planctomycetaceae bacterium]